MTLPGRQQLTIWGIAGAILILALWYVGDVILPFLLGGAVAYFLDPVADRMERIGMSRIMATILITLIAFLSFGLIVLLIIPPLVNQAIALVTAAPELFAQIQSFLEARFPSLMVEGSSLSNTLNNIGEAISSRGGELLQGALSSAMSVVNVVIFMLIVPVVSFYLLKDWDRMIAEIDALLPRDHADTIRGVARDIDATLASFVRGQATVCLILGTFYAVSLMLIGLNYGMVAGFIAGLLTFIPYVGALVGGVLAVGLALFQFWGEWWMVGGVAIIFAVGQNIEGNFLTPMLVGSSVGLHPVWLIFALSVFGALFGFVGMLVAVPIAAALGVIARFFITRYMESPLYKGSDTGNA